MSLANRLSPFATAFLSSHGLKNARRRFHEFRRKRKGQTHEVLFFHKVDDPYSYLLLQLLQGLMGDFDIKVKPHIIGELDENMFPEPRLLEKWSLQDAKLLADAFNLDFPETDALPLPSLCKRAEKILLSNEQSDSFLKFAIDVNHALWKEGEPAIEKLEQEVGHVSDEQREYLLKKSQAILKAKGHYLSAMLYYGGEWYWGADRIFHLAERLSHLDIAKTSVDLSAYDYPQHHGEAQSISRPLDFYFSFRSPYSYLAAQKLGQLKQIYPLDIKVKPVLPMVMRGLPVPPAKRLYIFTDTKREADRYNIPFGRVVDPLGEGVNRSMAIFPYAQKKKLAFEYISSVSKGIWAEGKDVCRDSHLEELVIRSGLNWNEAKEYLKENDWQSMAEKNREDLLELGFWGVPCFQYGDHAFWGQDRLWAIEKLFINN